MYFNSHLFIRPDGNIAVDPLPLDEADAAELHDLGGVASIVVTNRDHARDAAALKERFGAKIVVSTTEAKEFAFTADVLCDDGDEVFEGAFVLALQNQKTNGEFALHFPKQRMVLVGDAVLGSPVGSLSMQPDERYQDVGAAALSLRRLLAVQPEVLLLGDGASVYSGATKLLSALLRKRAGIEAYRINVDELRFEPYAGPGDYHCLEAEVGYWIGAEKLGYCVVTLPPGAKVCPLHDHAQSEELFFVLAGQPSVRALDGTIECRKGDFIAFPTGPSGTHQLVNESDADATVLLLGTEGSDEVCYYPDSNKVLIDPGRLILRAAPVLDYYDSE